MPTRQDNEREGSQVVIEQFAGMVTNRGPLFGPQGVAEWQQNLKLTSEGKLEGRSGLRIVSWEN